MKARGPGATRSGAEAVDAYLGDLPARDRAALEKVRRAIRRAAPDATEGLGYRMPAFRYEGALVYYAAFHDHLSFFPGSIVTARRFAAELRPFAAGKGTFRFTADHPIPTDLIARIVRARIEENLRRVERRRTVRRQAPRARATALPRQRS